MGAGRVLGARRSCAAGRRRSGSGSRPTSTRPSTWPMTGTGSGSTPSSSTPAWHALHGHGRPARAHGPALGGRARPEPTPPGRPGSYHRPGRGGHHLPDRHDLLLRAGAPARAGAGRGVGAARARRPSTTPASCRRPAKRGALIGMALTERTGGSDLRTCGPSATPIGDGRYELSGIKWFVSAVGVGRLLRPRPLPRRAVVLLRSPARRRRAAQRVPDRPAEGQAREPVERHRRGGADPGGRGPRRRGGRGRAGDHGHDRRHPPRLRPGVGGGASDSAWRRRSTTPATGWPSGAASRTTPR